MIPFLALELQVSAPALFPFAPPSVASEEPLVATVDTSGNLALAWRDRVGDTESLNTAFYHHGLWHTLPPLPVADSHIHHLRGGWDATGHLWVLWDSDGESSRFYTSGPLSESTEKWLLASPQHIPHPVVTCRGHLRALSRSFLPDMPQLTSSWDVHELDLATHTHTLHSLGVSVGAGDPQFAANHAHSECAIWPISTEGHFAAAARHSDGSWHSRGTFAVEAPFTSVHCTALDGQDTFWVIGSIPLADPPAYWVAQGFANGTWSAPSFFPEIVRPYSLEIAVDRFGNGVLVWATSDGVFCVSKPSEAPWSAPLRLGTFGATSPQVQVDHRGQFLLIWQEPAQNNVQGCIFSALSETWSSAQTLFASPRPFGLQELLLNENGQGALIGRDSLPQWVVLPIALP